MPETFKKFSDFAPKNNVQPNTLRYVALDESNQNVLVQADIPGGPITVNEANELIGPVVVSVSTDAELESVELEEGQLAYSSDTSIFRLGDGSTLGGLRFPRFFDNRSIQLTNTTLYAIEPDGSTFFGHSVKSKPGHFSLDFNIPTGMAFSAVDEVPLANSSIVLGYRNKIEVSGSNSIAIGGMNTISATGSLSLGFGNEVTIPNQVSIQAPNGLRIPRNASDVMAPQTGTIYFNTSTNKFRGYNGTAWVDLG